MFLIGLTFFISFSSNLSISSKDTIIGLTLFRMGFFGAAHGCGGTGRGEAKRSPSLKSVIYPTMMKLRTVILYLRKIKKIYKSRDAPLKFY